jgi:type II secretory pathway predicted ATPase ExeA
MYNNHFGIERRIFSGNVAGADVFVGPQVANVLQGINKALTAPDAVVTLTGPVGCGKSTAVAHSLAAINGNNAIVRIGRFPLQRGELLDLMFDHMRIQQRPQHGIQKLALFRTLLFNLAKNDSRMFILVEDATFLGPDMLAELETVTAADTGPSDGAAIVLMGDDYLKELLASKPLARLRQRIRLRRSLAPCGVEELGGYLRHSFRRAGGDFDTIFADGAAELLYDLSGGILRVVNNLVESSMEAAADAEAAVVNLELISRIANEEFGLTGTFTHLPEIRDEQPEPEFSDDTTARLMVLSMPDQDTAAGSVMPGSGDQQIPELIQDTQPTLPVLSDAPAPAQSVQQERSPGTLPNIEEIFAELSAEAASPGPGQKPSPVAKPSAGTPAGPKPGAKPQPDPEPAIKVELGPESEPDSEREPAVEPELAQEPEPAVDDPIPTLTAATGPIGSPAADTSADENIPDWERDSTLAELRPDLDALERAMAVANGRHAGTREDATPDPEAEQKQPPGDEIEAIPEITLDDSINRRVDMATLKREKRLEKDGMVEEQDTDAGVAEISREARAPEEGSAAQLEKIALDLARAKSIEDVDDRMAETLFGEELSAAAAAVAERVAEEAAAEAAKADETPAAAGPAPKPELEQESQNAWGEMPFAEISIDSAIEDQQGGMDISASQRRSTVRALNEGNPGIATANASATPAAPAVKPDPIEEQITTSLTQTMHALRVNTDPAAVNDDDDDNDDDGRKGGFLSRFRRS